MGDPHLFLTSKNCPLSLNIRTGNLLVDPLSENTPPEVNFLLLARGKELTFMKGSILARNLSTVRSERAYPIILVFFGMRSSLYRYLVR